MTAAFVPLLFLQSLQSLLLLLLLLATLEDGGMQLIKHVDGRFKAHTTVRDRNTIGKIGACAAVFWLALLALMDM